jgi:hypothetical protein
MNLKGLEKIFLAWTGIPAKPPVSALGMQYCPCISLMTTKYIAFHLHDTVRLGFSVVFEKKI